MLPPSPRAPPPPPPPPTGPHGASILAGLRNHEARVGTEGPPPPLQQPQQQQPQPPPQQQQQQQQHAWEGREVHQNARLIEDTDTAIEKISAEVQEMCDLFVSLGGLVEAQAQPIETIQDAAHRAAERTAAAVGELQTTVEKQGDCLVQ